MADWTLLGDGQLAQTFGSTLATDPTTNTNTAVGCRGVALTTGATAQTKGAWVTVIASVPFDASGFILSVPYMSAISAAFIDIGVGVTPQIILADFMVNAMHLLQAGYAVYIPIGLRSGEVVSARVQCSATAGVVDVLLTPVGVGFAPASPLSIGRAYGALTNALTRATTVNPYTGGTQPTDKFAGVKGAYSVLGAGGLATGTVSEPISQLLVTFGSRGTFSQNTNRWAVDIAVGAAGSEQIIIGDLLMAMHVLPDHPGSRYIGPFPCHIPSGSSLSARTSINLSGQVSNYTFGMLVHGFS